MAFDLLAINLAYKAAHGDLESLAAVIESGDAQRIALAMSDPGTRDIIVKLLRGKPLRAKGERLIVKNGKHRKQLMIREIAFLHFQMGLPAYSSVNPDDMKTACGQVAKVFCKSGATVRDIWKEALKEAKKNKA